MTPEELDALLRKPEGTRLELKAASGGFSASYDLPDYCAALANEGGGLLILGVENHSHKVIGSQAFTGNENTIPHELYQQIRHRVDTEVIDHQDGRVVVFHVPGRARGQLIASTGHFKYPMRVGESLTEMDQATIRRILTESDEDSTSLVVPGLTIADLDPNALLRLKDLRAEKLKRPEYRDRSDEQVLRDLGLASDDGVTRAALILLGSEVALTRHLANAEIIFEWRQDDVKISHDYRSEWRKPFLLAQDEIWSTINARNARTPYQEGFIEHEILAFDERSVREAVLNAVAHRDYKIQGQSVFIRATPEYIVIESPGGFPLGITPENALTESKWRNRLLAEVLGQLDLVNRSGQGLDDIFAKAVRDGKGLPSLADSNDLRVRLTIPTRPQDIGFVRYIEHVANEKQVHFSLTDLLALEHVRLGLPITDDALRKKFLALGIIELVGRGRGTKYILSLAYYTSQKRAGVHTRLVGLSRDAKKELILKHLAKKPAGMDEFIDAFPQLTRAAISQILQELRRAGKIGFHGGHRSGKWALR